MSTLTIDAATRHKNTEALATAYAGLLLRHDTTAWTAFIEAHPNLKISLRLLDALVFQPLAALHARHRALETKVAALEAQPRGLEYRGIWSDGDTYMKGDVVSRQGSMWVCKLNHCQSIPGADSGVGWQLAVKSGRDARTPR